MSLKLEGWINRCFLGGTGEKPLDSDYIYVRAVNVIDEQAEQIAELVELLGMYYEATEDENDIGLLPSRETVADAINKHKGE